MRDRPVPAEDHREGRVADRQGRSATAEPTTFKRPAHGRSQDGDGDEVEHDRGDHLVRARDRLQEARDEAPRGPEGHAGEQRDGDRDDRAGCRQSCTPTMTDPRAPIRNWPCTPMLNRPALNPRPTARPPRSSGVVCDERVDDGAFGADRPGHERAVGVERQDRAAASPVTSHCEKMMTSEPTRTDRTIEMSGRARIAPGAYRVGRSCSRSPGPSRHRRPCLGRVGRLAAAGRHQQADLVLVGRPPVAQRPTSRPR